MSSTDWIVYILELANGYYYTGITNNLERRLKQHAAGKGSKIVRTQQPFRVVYTESAKNRSEASKREWAIKQLSRAEKESIINDRQRY